MMAPPMKNFSRPPVIRPLVEGLEVDTESPIQSARSESISRACQSSILTGNSVVKHSLQSGTRAQERTFRSRKGCLPVSLWCCVVDQLSKYGRLLARGDLAVATCYDCDGGHAILDAQSLASDVHARHTPSLRSGRARVSLVECRMVSVMAKSKAGQAKQNRREHDEVGAELAALLRERQEEIATAWTEMVQALPGSLYSSLPPEEVRSLTLRGIGAMVESLETGPRAALDEYLADICPAGGQAVPDVAAVVETLLLCKDAALPIIRDACGPDSSATWALVSELEECLRWMVGRLTSLCTSEISRQLQEEKARVAILLDMVETVSSTLELDHVVSRVAEEIVTALGVDACTFHLVDEEQRSAVFLRRPADWASRVFRSFDSYKSYFHEVLTTREPVTSYDVQSDPRFPLDTARELRAKSTVGVPLMVKGKVIAVAWAYTVDDYRRFTDEEIALAQGIGNMLGLVIQNAQLYERSKVLTVMEERSRLSREIHDGVAQTLGALQLKASQLEDSLSNQQVDELRGLLSELQDMISRAYRDLREAMLGLRTVVEPGTDLVTVLREYLTHYQAQYGLDVRLEANEGEPAALDGEEQAQAMRIVQEALRNVRRHAGTARATVRIERHAGGLRICVVDEGQGFDQSLLGGWDDSRHLGLRTMRERAQSVGGTVAVESQPGHGTTVVLQLPLYEDGGPE